MFMLMIVESFKDFLITNLKYFCQSLYLFNKKIKFLYHSKHFIKFKYLNPNTELRKNNDITRILIKLRSPSYT